jgi:hypothetical protein
MNIPIWLVLWNIFSHILGILIPTDEGLKPPTSNFLRQ